MEKKYREEEANTRAHDNNPFVEVFQCNGIKQRKKKNNNKQNGNRNTIF